MSDQKKLIESYAKALKTVSETININNTFGKEEIIIELVKKLDKLNASFIKMLQYDERIEA